MRRNAGRHSNRNTTRAIDQQVGKLAWEYGWLVSRFIVGRDVVDGVQLDVIKHGRSNSAQTGFGIPHGCRWQTGNASEVALFVDEHAAHVPFLCHPYQSRIDDAFTVWVIVSGRVPGNLGALDPFAAGAKVQVVHCNENSTLTGFQAIAHIWKSATDNHAHRVRQIAVTKLVLDRQVHHAQGAGATACALALWADVRTLVVTVFVVAFVFCQCPDS